MFENLFSALQRKPHNDDNDLASRRKHPRRDCDHCVSEIDGKTYPVENWSMGGALIYTDSRLFGLHKEIDVNLKFKLRDEVMEVPHKAKVVRKMPSNKAGMPDRIALEFLPLSTQIKRRFQSVVDDFVSAEFADSQLA